MGRIKIPESALKLVKRKLRKWKLINLLRNIPIIKEFIWIPSDAIKTFLQFKESLKCRASLKKLYSYLTSKRFFKRQLLKSNFKKKFRDSISKKTYLTLSLIISLISSLLQKSHIGWGWVIGLGFLIFPIMLLFLSSIVSCIEACNQTSDYLKQLYPKKD